MNSIFELEIDFKNDCNWIYAFFVKFEICKHIRLYRGHSKNPNNLHKNSLFSKRYVIRNETVMENYKWWFKKIISLLSSISTGHMPDRAQKIWDLSFHYCNNDISFASTGTRACRFGLLWSWMVHESFACSA